MISVCMATYNGEKYIEAQVRSILNQIGNSDELIVSDDGSTDSTISIIESLNDKRIRVINNKNKVRGGNSVKIATANFENALIHAKGDYIFLSDQDDVWLPEKVSIMMKYLQKYDYVGSDCLITDIDLNIVAQSRYGQNYLNRPYLSLFIRTPFQGGCSAMTRRLLDKALPFPKNIQSHDRWLGFVGSIIMKSYIMIPDKLILYRRHGNNVSIYSGDKGNPLWVKIKERLIYTWAIFRRKYFRN